MAPEQMRSARNADARSDIWALGVVLYELLTGKVPFDAESMPELCLKVVSDPMPSLREIRPEIPEALELVVRTCLEKKPDNRYSDPAELSAALAPFAPETARETIERTRLVTTRMSTTGGSPRKSLVSAKATSQPELRQTPVPWAGTQGEAKKSEKGKIPIVAVVVAGIVAVAAVAAITLTRAPTPAAPATVAAPPPPAQPTISPAIATTSAPTPLALVPTAPSSAASSADAAPSAAPLPGPAKLAPLRPIGPVPTKRRDDEIPSIR